MPCSEVEVGIGLGDREKKATTCSLCPKGMCLSNPGGLPQRLRAVSETCWEQRKGLVQFSLSPSEPEGSPATQRLTCHVSSHVPRLFTLDVTRPADACRSSITPRVLQDPAAASSSSSNHITFGCYRKRNSSCLCRKWPPECWSLEL